MNCRLRVKKLQNLSAALISVLSYSALLTRCLPTWHLLLLSNHLSPQNKWLIHAGIIISCSKVYTGSVAGQKLNSYATDPSNVKTGNSTT